MTLLKKEDLQELKDFLHRHDDAEIILDVSRAPAKPEVRVIFYALKNNKHREAIYFLMDDNA